MFSFSRVKPVDNDIKLEILVGGLTVSLPTFLNDEISILP